MAKPNAYRSTQDRRRRPRTNDRTALTLADVSVAWVSSDTRRASALAVTASGRHLRRRVDHAVGDNRALGQPHLACPGRQGEVVVVGGHDDGAAVARVTLAQQPGE